MNQQTAPFVFSALSGVSTVLCNNRGPASHFPNTFFSMQGRQTQKLPAFQHFSNINMYQILWEGFKIMKCLGSFPQILTQNVWETGGLHLHHVLRWCWCCPHPHMPLWSGISFFTHTRISDSGHKWMEEMASRMCFGFYGMVHPWTNLTESRGT